MTTFPPAAADDLPTPGLPGTATILLVDDQPTQRRLLYHALKDAFRVLEAGDGAEALRRWRAEPVDLVVLDLHLPPHAETAEEGVRVLGAVRTEAPRLPVVIVTGDQDRQLALDMVRRGVADFLLKPVEADVLKVVIQRALERARLQSEIDALRERVSSRSSFGGLIGRSPVTRELFATLERLARMPATVLLLGESGTGKSAVARALHVEGPRAARPFVVVDGSTIPETLIESELFGHVRGAFTGAESDHAGRVQMADGGTLFLDEIGDLSPSAQSKLLLFLDRHSVTAVGSAREVRVDVRLVAATHRDVERLAAEGRLRTDLLYRLQVATVTLPPLRERREDIAPLAEYFLASLGKEWGRPGARLTPLAIARLETHPWPGNVRQLRHAIESSLALAGSDVLDADRLTMPAAQAADGAGESSPAGTRAPAPGRFKERIAEHELRLLKEALAATRGNKAAAGRLLGLDENQIRYLCRKRGLR